MSQIGGNQRGAKIELTPEIKKIFSHQVKVGGLKDGDTAFVKFAGDGFNIAKRDVATAHTITVSNTEKALQIGTISIVNAGENYQAFSIFHISKTASPNFWL